MRGPGDGNGDGMNFAHPDRAVNKKPRFIDKRVMYCTLHPEKVAMFYLIDRPQRYCEACRDRAISDARKFGNN